MSRRMRPGLAVAVLVGMLAVLAPSATLAARADDGADGPRSSDPPEAVHHDQSAPLSAMAAAAPADDGAKPKKEHAEPSTPFDASTGADAVVQGSAPTPAAATAGAGFDGLGVPLYTPNAAPPDPNGDVSPTQYVQIVNEAFAVFDKSGNLLLGPVNTNTLWQGFGGGCQANNDGDATVKYDRAAQRWVFQQFSVSTTPYLDCVAVSTGPDAVTSTYNRYSFSYSNFPDYPKLGIWSDAYYTTFNLFRNGVRFVGAEMCAYDRTSMLAGLAATQQCFTVSQPSLLPSDLDGATAPPAGSPAYAMDLTSNGLRLWRFHVDWANPTNSTLTGPTTIPVASFSNACGGGVCVPQLGTSQQLDSLADRLMYRLAYRNFGDHESLVVNHSVNPGDGTSAVRWYEIRSPATTPTVFQSGTYAPSDGVYRWMGSAAMDGSGDIGMGYSVSSGAIHPGIRFTGRQVGDPPGTLQAETTVLDGTGSQSGNNLDRWGDYSSIAVDPADDCTFWYTTEYLKATGSFNWSTRIASFSFPNCGSPDFSLSASPTSQTVTAGGSAPSTITVNPVGGFNGSVTLSASGLPSSATATFATNPTTSTSTMTLATSASTPAGSYPITVTGTSGSLTHTTTFTLVVQQPDFTISASPSSRSVRRNRSTSYTVSLSPAGGFNSLVNLGVTGLPAGVTASFSPVSLTPPGSSTMTVRASSSATLGTFTLTITGTGGGRTHSTTVTITVRNGG